MVQVDPILLERALLNLLSNAMRFGKKELPITMTVELTPAAVHLQLKNACASSDSDLLTAAFRRATERGAIPDPRWGLGLGLPVALSIARLMGGTIAVDVDSDQMATVSMSISRKRDLRSPELRNHPAYDYTGGLRRTLLELSDVLQDDCFDSTVI